MQVVHEECLERGCKKMMSSNKSFKWVYIADLIWYIQGKIHCRVSLIALGLTRNMSNSEVGVTAR